MFGIGSVVLFITVLAISVSLYKGVTSGPSPNECETAECISTGVTSGQSPNECETAECISTAERITSYMDPGVNPCNDFYRFACGNFLKKAKIKDDRTIMDTFTEMSDILKDQLKQLVYEKPRPDEARPFYYLKSLFQLCLDEEAIEKRGTGHLVERLNKAGGWPVLGNWQGKDWDWFTTELQLRQMYMDDGSMFSTTIMEDFGQSNRRIIWIDQGDDLPLLRKYMTKKGESPERQAYFKYMVEVAVALGARRDDRLWKSLRQVLAFQVKLATIRRKEEPLDSRTYNLRTLKELLEDDRLNWIDWRTYFATIMPKGVTLKEDELFSITDFNFFKQLLVLILKTPKEVLANHMMFMAVHTKVSYLPKELRDRKFDLRKAVFGRKTDVPRWEMCIDMVKSLNLALSSLYIKKFFDHSSKEVASEMLTRIRKELMEDFKGLDWMDPATREKAESKVSLMYELIGYAEEITNIAKLEEHYSEMKLNTEHLFEAQLDLSDWNTRYLFQLLREPVDKKDWRQFGTISEVNAFYYPVQNAMVFPASILQPPLFGSKVPSYVNYAAIGSIMGHELTYSFDDEGSQYNAKGDLEEWWDESSRKKFNEKKKCVVDQYSAFREPQTKLNLNGIHTQGKNVADIGGLKMAFRAYRHRARQLPKPEPMLPGLTKYTREQLFMISLANTLCSVSTPVMMWIDVVIGVYSPAEFRVNGMLMNLEEFGDLFNCKPGTPMNPHKKCNVW